MKFDPDNLNPVQAVLIVLLLIGLGVGMNWCGSGESSKVSAASAAKLERTIEAVSPSLVSEVEPGWAGSVTVTIPAGEISADTAISIWQAWAATTDAEVAQVYFHSSTGRKLGHVRGVAGDPSPTVRLK